MAGLLKVKRDRGYAVQRDEKERPKGNQRTSLRSDHHGAKRALTMARNERSRCAKYAPTQSCDG
jgi:hypothetical protein